METETFARIHPQEFYRKFLEQSVRPDGRNLTTSRAAIVAGAAIKSADGSAMAKIGNTTVVCGIKLEVGVPPATAPREGRVAVAMHLTPLCSPKFNIGRASPESVNLSQQLENIILGAKTLDLTQFCIQEGVSSWTAYADIQCLDYDGNVLDTALLALVAALGSVQLPETDVGDDNVVYLQPEGKSTPLILRRFPIALSFASLDQYIMTDPNAKEEEVASARWTVVKPSLMILLS